MTAPRYTRGYSFSGFQASSPSSPLPGSRVDNELDNIAQVTDNHRDRLAQAEADIDVNMPSEAQIAAIEAAGETAIEAVQDQQTTSVAAVVTQQGTSVSAVSAQQTTSVNAVAAQEATSIAAVEAQEATSIAAVEAQEATSVAAVASAAGGNVYADTTAGLAATSSGGYFYVKSTVDGEALIQYLDNAGVAVEQLRTPSAEATRKSAKAAAKSLFMNARYLRELSLPAALIELDTGQSNNETRNETGVSGGVATGTITGITHTSAYMPVGGNSRQRWDYNASNAEWAVDWNEVSSFVTHQEGDSMEGSGGGACAAFSDRGPHRRLYRCSAAIGSRDWPTLMQGGPLANAHGLLRRMCAQARSDGYRPEISYTSVIGEAAMAAGVSESTFYTNGMDAFGLLQLWAAQQMGRPDYKAPIIMAFPMQMYSANSIDIIRALGRILGDTPNALSIGGIYPFQGANDRVHNTNTGAVQRGESFRLRSRRFFEDGDVSPPMMATDVTWNGTTTCVVRFTHDVTIDSPAFDFGTNLNTSNALYGMEWVDNGSYVKINTAVASGRKITLTLNATPAGTVDQQRFRIAVPTTTVSVVAGSSNRAGCVVRKSGTGVASIIDSTFTHYEFACPQEHTVRAA